MAVIGGAKAILLKDNFVLFSSSSSSCTPGSPPCSLNLPRRRREVAALAVESTKAQPSLRPETTHFCRPQPAAISDPKEKQHKKEEAIAPELLDNWVRSSIGEIVKKLGRAPFLVQLPRVWGEAQEEEASEKSWKRMKRRWEREERKPDGVVLVEEVDPGWGEEQGLNSRTWGLLVQGRGLSCALCYLLSTTRFDSPLGGPACTHFCLVKANCCSDVSLGMQLRNAWLLR